MTRTCRHALLCPRAPNHCVTNLHFCITVPIIYISYFALYMKQQKRDKPIILRVSLQLCSSPHYWRIINLTLTISHEHTLNQKSLTQRSKDFNHCREIVTSRCTPINLCSTHTLSENIILLNRVMFYLYL